MCGDCRYCHRTGIFDEGECRRLAPTLSIDAKERAARWPIISLSHDWCGLFQLGRRQK